MTETVPQRPAELGVVLVTDRAETIAHVLGCLREQTARDRLEIVVVSPAFGEADAGPDQDAFASVQVVRIPALDSLEHARAVAVRQATAPIVFLGETHSFPEPDFAETLIAAHAGPWAAVAPALGNANPDSALALASLILDYGRWLAPGLAREVDTVPDFNCSFKRDLLLESSRELEELFVARGCVADDLRGRGHRLFVEPAARLDHLNVSRPWAWLAERYLAGRILGGTRAARWSRSRRLLYLGGSALVPVLHLARAARVVRRLALPGRRRPAIAAALLVGSLAWTLGEAVGYVRGTGGAARRMMKYELHKTRYASVGAR